MVAGFLAVSQYITRYNNVANVIRYKRSQCTKFGLDHNESSWNHCPPSGMENDEVKILISGLIKRFLPIVQTL